jgi:hypothetical protein
MSRAATYLRLALVLCCVAAVSAGCRGCECGTAKPEDTRSKLQYFKETQGPTVTPHGTIKMETAEETADGRIQYQTEDGKTWRVGMTKQADGTYRYGTPAEVK